MIKIQDPATGRAFWLRANLLQSSNGFRKVAEIRAVLFSKRGSKEVQKTGLKQTFDLREASIENVATDRSPLDTIRVTREVRETTSAPIASIRIADCDFSEDRTSGRIQSKGRTLSWDLQLTKARDLSFSWVPPSLIKAGLTHVRAATPGEDLRATGWIEIDGERWEWNSALAAITESSGPSFAKSWIWAHCNSFVDERGEASDAVFEGISARDRILGLFPSPKISTFFLIYKSRHFAWNTLWRALRVRSSHGHTDWNFVAESGDFAIHGAVRSEHRDFAGVTYEDTDGSLLYCATAQLADISLSVYRRGKLETTLRSPGGASLEVVTASQNPYVSVLM